MLGRELIIDIEKIEDYQVLERIETIRPLMEKIIENCFLNVKNFSEFQFEPYGVTMLYLLSESHLTIHTYVNERSCSINLYTCNDKTDLNQCLEIIYEYFKKPSIKKLILTR
jgi:S-adenosylmethionine decarboxylase